MFNPTTARNMAVVINPPLIMNVTFEHLTVIFDNKIAKVCVVKHIAKRYDICEFLLILLVNPA